MKNRSLINEKSAQHESVFLVTIYRQIAGSIDAIEKEFPNQTLVGYPENWLTQSEKAEALYPAPAGYSNITAQKVFDVCATFFEKQTFIENEIQIGYV